MKFKRVIVGVLLLLVLFSYGFVVGEPIPIDEYFNVDVPYSWESGDQSEIASIPVENLVKNPVETRGIWKDLSAGQISNYLQVIDCSSSILPDEHCKRGHPYLT